MYSVKQIKLGCKMLDYMLNYMLNLQAKRFQIFRLETDLASESIGFLFSEFLSSSPHRCVASLPRGLLLPRSGAPRHRG